MSLQPAGPLDVVDVLRDERAAFIELLRSLEPADWARRTECPAYDVSGVAAHLLGDDLSLLARQRDGATPGIVRLLEPGQDFRTTLDRFNDGWVDTVQFFSPALLVDLLDLTGRWTADWYGTVDLESLGEPVGFFAASGPSPYWQIAAREYVERWVHHHQIRRALDRAGLDDDTFLLPAAATVARGLAAHFTDLGAAPGDSLCLSVDQLADWSLRRTDQGWDLFDGRAEDATAALRLDRALATQLLSRGLAAAEVTAALSVTGDLELGRRAVAGMAALAGR